MTSHVGSGTTDEGAPTGPPVDRSQNPGWAGKRKGVRRPRWRNGYVEEWCPVRGRYVGQHRLVMERELGRFLSSSEVVHHRNHVKVDNRLENLELCASQGQHRSLHRGPIGPRPHTQRPKIPCPVCGSMFKPRRRSLPSGERVDTATCSASCGQTLRHRRPTA